MSEEKPTEPIVPQQQRLYANVDNPTIHAVIKSLFSFENEKQAYGRIKSIKRQFVTSKQAETSENSHSIILWILGYEVSEEEAALGYKGNFACLSVAPKGGDKFTIKATKIQSELSFHPQRNRRTGKHPDWGHPILRDIYKKRVYPTLEAA